MPPVTTPGNVSQFGDLTNEAIQKIFVMRNELPMQIDKYFNVTDSTSFITQDSSVLGSERARFIGDNASVIYDAPLQGFNQSYTQIKYGDGLQISDHLWRFGIQFRNITVLTETLVDAMREKSEEDGADMLNNSFGTSYPDADGRTVSTTGGNAVAYFSASQTREDGGTVWNNIVTDGTTTNMDFDYDAMRAVRRTAGLIVSGRGQQLGIMPNTLICRYGSTVHSRYEEIMGAISRNQLPGSDENDGAAKVGLPNLITLKHLDNDAFYWAFDSSKKGDRFGLQWVWAKRPTLDAPELEYDSDLYKRKATMFYTRGANNMRPWVGSQGTNA